MDIQQNLKTYYFYIFAFIIVSLYIYLGIYLNESVFFSYDMPRVGLIIQNFLNSGTYMTSQYFYSESTWQNVAWGPALVFFYSVFLKISSDPIITSYLLVLLNSFSIFAIMLLGKKYFSERVGIIAGALLAFNPYWFTYTRIIYQPSPLTFFLPIAMLLHFGFIKSNKYSIVMLPLVWTAMFQIYIPSLAFILTSFLFLIFYLNKTNYKYIIVGVLLTLLLIIPSLKFYKENPNYIGKFFSAPKLFTPTETTYKERIKNVATSFINIPVGGMFRWQTGSSYDDFIGNNKLLAPNYSKLLTIIFVISLMSNIYLSIKNRDAKRGVIIAWSLSTLWYLIVLWTSALPPRYFLISFPPIMFMLAISVEDIYMFFKSRNIIKHLGLLISVLTIMYWVMFDIKYNKFIKNYDFPHGWFYDVSESPYIYIRETIDWIIYDSTIAECNPVISNDVNNPYFGLWMEFEYPWRYVYNKSTIYDQNVNNCQYFIFRSDNELQSEYLKRFGPFMIYKSI